MSSPFPSDLEDFLVDFTTAGSSFHLPVEPCLLGLCHKDGHTDVLPTGQSGYGECFLFQYTISGCGVFVTQGGRHRIQSGEAFLSCSPASCECIPVSEGDAYRSLFFLLRGEAALSLGTQLLEKNGSVVSLSQGSPALELLFEHLRKLQSEGRWDLSEESLFGYQFLLSLLQDETQAAQPVVSASAPIVEPSDNGGIPENLQRAAEYVEAHLADTLLNVDALARVAGISKYHFIRTFEKTYGISPWKYLLARRLYHAAQLLAQDKTMPLKVIIQQCGFTSETYFCRAFRKTYQRSPGNHRRLMSSEIPTTL